MTDGSINLCKVQHALREIRKNAATKHEAYLQELLDAADSTDYKSAGNLS